MIRDPELTRMRGLWAMRKKGVAIVSDAYPPHWEASRPLIGISLSTRRDNWAADGAFYGDSMPELDLVEKLGEPDDLRAGADRLMGLRCYVAAAALYAMLGDQERTEEAIGLVRQAKALEADAEKEKPF